MTKTYVVAGLPRSGTTLAMKCHIYGGIPGLYREIRQSERGYPHQVYEYKGGKLKLDEVQGKVVKRFRDTLIHDLPDDIENVRVMYIVRDPAARLLAHPGEAYKDPAQYYADHIRWIQSISQDKRVVSLVVVDFDELIDKSKSTLQRLKEHGWNIDPAEGARAVNFNERHAKRGDTEAKGVVKIDKTSKKAEPHRDPVLIDKASQRIAMRHAKRMGM